MDSYQFIPRGEPLYPFKAFISDQYSKRMQLQRNKDPLERAVKLILNSMYEKMAQRVNGVIGNLFNPVIASFITGYTRAQLYNFMRKNSLDREIVSFATDSIACRRKREGIVSKDLGKMKLDKEGDDAIFLSTGFYRFNGVWKQRGVGYDKGTKALIEHQDTRISEDGQLYIAVKTMRTTHIRTGICYNKHESIGRIEVYEKKIGLNSDKKRFWADDLRLLNDGSVCDSAPLNINAFADVIADQEVEWENEKEERYEPESNL